MDAIYLDQQPTKDAFLRDVAAAYDNPATFPDLKVKCSDGTQVQVHKFVVCKQSAWFEKACTSGFKESQSNEITIQDDALAIRAMLHYCYTFGYQMPTLTTRDTECEAFEPCHFHVRMFAMAEFYQVRGLAKIAKERFVKEAESLLAVGGVEELAATIDYVYKNISDPKKLLRDAIVDLVLQNRTKLLKEPGTPLVKLLEDVQAFAIDMAMALALALRDNGFDQYRCPGCYELFQADLSMSASYHCCPSCGFMTTHSKWNHSHLRS